MEGKGPGPPAGMGGANQQGVADLIHVWLGGVTEVKAGVVG